MGIRSLSTASIATGQKRSKFWDQSATLPPVGDYESIATVTTAGTFTFSSIPSTYKHLEIRAVGKSSNGTYQSIYWTMRLNGDSTSGKYNCHSLYGNGGGSVAAMGNGTYTDQMIIGEIAASGSGMASQTVSPFIVNIADYASTSKTKIIRSFVGFDGSGVGTMRLASGMWNDTSAISSITIYGSDTGVLHAALYGIKG